MVKNEKAVVACLLALFACRALLASVIVQPWQGPDEPGHFIPAQLLARPDGGRWDATVAVQSEVLKSMGTHRWWEPYGGRTPDPLPTTLSGANARLSIGTYTQPMYYGAGAAFLRVIPAATLDGAYWRMRIFSVLLALATLAVGWAGTGLLFGPGVALGATAIASLHPQFLLTAISVNPDALVILLGTIIWWLVASVIRGRRVHLSLLLILVTAVAVALTKRNAIPLAFVAALTAAVSLVRPETLGINTRMAGRVLAVFAVVVTLSALLFLNLAPQLVVSWTSPLQLRRPPDQWTLRNVLDYAQLSVDYVWLIVGWLRFSAPEPWLWVVRTLTVVGFGSAAVLAIRSRDLRRPMAIAGIFVCIQVAVVIPWGFLTLSSPQGRYLLPVIAPATALLWLGLINAAPSRLRPYAAPTLIALLAVMDVTAFTAVLIPAYLPWG